MINFLLFILVLPLLPHVEIMSNITSQMILFKDFLCRNFGQASFFLIAVSSPIPTFLKVMSIVISKLKPQMQTFHLNLESWYQKVIIRSVLVEIFMCLWTSRGQGTKWSLRASYAWVRELSSKTLRANENENQSFRKFSISQSTVKETGTCYYTSLSAPWLLPTDQRGRQDPLI